MSKKSLAVSQIEPVGGHGGMDYYDYGLAFGLGANDVKVYYFTCDETNLRHFKNVETIFSFKNLWTRSLITKSVKYISGHLKAFKILKKKKVEIVHYHFFFFRGIDLIILLLSRFFHFKIIVTIHDINSFHNNSSTFIENNCYKLIHGVIVHNEASYQMWQAKNSFQKPVAIIPHGNYLPFVTPVHSHISESSCFNLLFFGQIKEIKGLDLLLKALAIVIENGYKNIRLIIKGKPYKNDISKYEKLIRDLGIIQFVEYDFRYIPDDEVASAFENADLVILPYTEIYQSGVLLLSLSYGRPVLCSDLEPFKEVIEDQKSGLIFKSGNIKDLAQKIQFSIENPDKLNNISKEAQNIIREKFDWVHIGLQTKLFYQTIL